jgi:hypothetical protein
MPQKLEFHFMEGIVLIIDSNCLFNQRGQLVIYNHTQHITQWISIVPILFNSFVVILKWTLLSLLKMEWKNLNLRNSRLSLLTQGSSFLIITSLSKHFGVLFKLGEFNLLKCFRYLFSGRHKQEESLFEEMLQVSNAVVRIGDVLVCL